MDSSILSSLMLGDPCSPSFVRQVKARISAAESNIARLDTQDPELTRLRDQELELLAALKPLIAPIRKLPVELLTEIFLLIVDSMGDWLTHALLVSQICAHWRRVACATPQLWNREIALNLTKPRSDAYLATTKTFFERSEPLSIPVVLDKEPTEASSLAKYIYGLAPRWKSLSWTDCASSRLQALPVRALNSLESVVIFHCSDVPSSSPVDVFLGVQSLRAVTLDVWSMECFRIPWSQLTSLIITEDPEEEEPPKPAQLFLDILLQCANVVDVHFFNVIPWIEAPAFSTPSTQLPRLQELTVLFAGSHSGGEDATPFFSQLALPALTSLCVFSDSVTWWSPADFSQFQRRSPNVEELHLMGISLTSDGVASLLAEYPHLVDIQLEDCFENNSAALGSALDLLTYNDTTTPTVPRLRRLKIEDRQVHSVGEATWERMIFSRWWKDPQMEPHSGVRLEALAISNDGGDDDEAEFSAPFVAKMEQLRAEGLQVTITECFLTIVGP
ncbi:hypothetical protein FB45DRAFT_999569 [Roridomyces roridus]|uniref:F-box domain-containing protein n=1 Tax=Roridomyces roridus TaxID=1738132 RepID=A0AAD7FYU5_9AGAR|nr:hypothetical protein FB45DRAFT_999569 [Roridomyces roridus]